jgi:hypothetical protein
MNVKPARSKQLTPLIKICKKILDAEKMPHPPAYTEIYPVVATEADENAPQMGWHQPPTTEIVNTIPVISQPIQPPPYATQQPGEIRECYLNVACAKNSIKKQRL